MTELSVMLISGTLGEGATVTVSANPTQQKLEYKVAGLHAVNGKKRANEGSASLERARLIDLEDDDMEAMED